MVRSAGLIGIATMASRLLGVVREMVLASLFGASATPAMDAFNVAFRVPNLVRDLFAEGAMTAAFVPTFTRTLQTRGREAAWRLGNLVINTLLVVTGAIVVARHPVRGADHTRTIRSARRVRGSAGEARAHDAADADHDAVPDDRRGRGRGDGHAERAAPVLSAGAVPRDVQRRDHPVRVR